MKEKTIILLLHLCPVYLTKKKVIKQSLKNIKRGKEEKERNFYEQIINLWAPCWMLRVLMTGVISEELFLAGGFCWLLLNASPRVSVYPCVGAYCSDECFSGRDPWPHFCVCGALVEMRTAVPRPDVSLIPRCSWTRNFHTCPATMYTDCWFTYNDNNNNIVNKKVIKMAMRWWWWR